MSTKRDWPVAPVTTSTLSMRRSGRARPGICVTSTRPVWPPGPGLCTARRITPPRTRSALKGHPPGLRHRPTAWSGPCPIGPAGRSTDEATPRPYRQPRTPGTVTSGGANRNASLITPLLTTRAVAGAVEQTAARTGRGRTPLAHRGPGRRGPCVRMHGLQPGHIEVRLPSTSRSTAFVRCPG
jgi:hypothetical protein